MSKFQHKKSFGQHFLKDDDIAKRIVDEFIKLKSCSKVLEIGPGEGVLTRLLINQPFELYVSEIDRDLIPKLKKNFNLDSDHLIEGDFLQIEIQKYFKEELCIIGNFPYNISSQIIFKILENKDLIPLMTGMFQKEVAERICAKHGNKTYGITSVITQAFFDTEYLFTVEPYVFDPPPQVKSAVIRIKRKEVPPDVSYHDLLKTVKLAFGQRRKMLRNALGNSAELLPMENHWMLQKRAEQLSVEDFLNLTKGIHSHKLN